MELPSHFFRHETGRIIATLSKMFGLQNIDLIEDATQDACGRAVQVWSVRGLPENPAGWLFAVAKNRTLDLLRRESRFRPLSPGYEAPFTEDDGDIHLIGDEQLRLMFSCGDPKLSEEAQVAITLHYLCGFGVKEVAQAYLSAFATVEKRLTRAKKSLAASGTLFNVSDRADFEERLPVVRRALYLLFNQGFHGGSAESAIQPLLCAEAIRLVEMILANRFGATTESYALAALMYLHAARLPAKLSAGGELTELSDQDRSRWDRGQLQMGMKYLAKASAGVTMTEYHLEALIAGVHATAQDFQSTDWTMIVQLYDALLQLNGSPVVELNRAIAISRAEGHEQGLAALLRIADVSRLEGYPFYWAALGESQLGVDQLDAARSSFERALAAARNPAERAHLEKRLMDNGGSLVAGG